jgi:putative transposase
MSRCRSYRYLIQPTTRQRADLERLLRHQCEPHNAALEERRGAWQWERRSVTYAQVALAAKRRGSRRRARAVDRVARAHRQIYYDLIVHEKLKVTNMTRRPKPRPNRVGGFDPNGAGAKAGLNRSINDAGWGQLLRFTAYKAEEAGREVIAVEPRYTSQRCSQCGHNEAANRVTQATFRCQSCGFSEHADVNAAVNILGAGRALLASACGGSEVTHYPTMCR